MTFLNKAIVTALLVSAIGTTTICMDTDNSIAPKYYLKILLYTGTSDEIENFEILTRAVGGKVIGVYKQNTFDTFLHALLPDQSKVGKGFVEGLLLSNKRPFNMRELSQKERHSKWNHIEKTVHANVPDQSAIGNDFIEPAKNEEEVEVESKWRDLMIELG